MRNRYPGTCEECGVGVDEGEGNAANPDGHWVTFCDDCHAEEEPSVRIRLGDQGRALAKAESYLGKEWFSAYRLACTEAGCSYDKARQANRCNLPAVPRLVEELKASGFRVSVDDAVKDALRTAKKTSKTSVEDTDSRIDVIEEKLAGENKKLFPFQRIGCRWLASRPGGSLLLDDPGLGEPIQALVALPENIPVLVICPSIAKGVWNRETPKWRDDYSVKMLKGRNSFQWPEPGQMVITNYDILPNIVGDGSDKKLRQYVHETCPENLVIIGDEAQAIKNNKSMRTKRFRSMTECSRKLGGKVWILTATPLLNKPSDLWALMLAAGVHIEAFGNWDRFVGLMGGKESRWGIEWSDTPSVSAPKFLQRVSLKRIREEVLPDLPVKTWTDLEVEISGAAIRACKKTVDLFSNMGIDIDQAIDDATFFQNRVTVLEEISEARAALANAKIPAMLKLIQTLEDANEPVVVFSAHRKPIDALSDRKGWAVITGNTSQADRAQIEDDFQAGKYRGIGLTIQAGGTAITLTHASQMIFVDLDWTPANNLQAEDRCCRIGQTRGVVVTRLIANHRLDQNITEVLARKQRLISGSVQASARDGDVDELLEVEELTPAPETAAIGQKPGEENGSRQPRHVQETWAHEALIALASLNGAGFDADDKLMGSELANRLESGDGLTDAQWRVAIEMAKRHWDRVGP